VTEIGEFKFEIEAEHHETESINTRKHQWNHHEFLGLVYTEVQGMDFEYLCEPHHSGKHKIVSRGSYDPRDFRSGTKRK
jgi:hypothetical protein